MDAEIQEFLSYWERRGTKLPNPEMYPKCFEYFVKIYKYYKSRGTA